MHTAITWLAMSLVTPSSNTCIMIIIQDLTNYYRHKRRQTHAHMNKPLSNSLHIQELPAQFVTELVTILFKHTQQTTFQLHHTSHHMVLELLP